jgi:hypothetical protein
MFTPAHLRTTAHAGAALLFEGGDVEVRDDFFLPREPD